ncbi:hypothetical protein Tco_0319634 [Tanacetum coccineum]
MDDSGIGSPGAMVQPIIDMRFPIADYIPGHRGHHHLDYVPGPEEPEQAPPSPIYIPFVPEPVYLEFLPVDDESRVFIPESDPEEDPEEDPEVDPADYPADRGDDDDDDDDAEEDEHLALADPTAIAYSADQDPYLAYRVTARMSIRPQAPRTVLSEEVAERIVSLTYYTTTTSLSYTHSTSQTLSAITLIPSPPPNGPYHMLRDLGIRAVGSRQRDALHLLSSAAGAARQVGPTIAEADLYGFADMLDAAPGRQTSKELGYGITDTWDDLLDDARYDRALLRARVNMLYRDRPFHRRTALLIEEEARLSRAAWARSMDACDQVHSEGISLRTTVMAQQSEITELQAADRRRQSVISDLLKADYRRQRQLVEALKIVKSLKTQMIELQRQQGLLGSAKAELPEEGQ